MKTNYKILYAEAYEYPAFEAYLHQMSLQGWQLNRVFPHLLRFVKDEETKYYSILFQNNFTSENPYDKTKETLKMSSFLEEFQLQYVCGFQKMQIYSSPKPCTIYTEPALLENTILKQSRTSFLNTAFILVLMAVLFLFSLAMDPHIELLKYTIIANVNAMALLLLYLCGCGYFLCQYLPYRHFKKTGQYIHDPSIFNTKRKFLSVFPLLALLLAGFLMNSYLIFILIAFAFLMQLIALYLPAFHKWISILSIAVISFLYSMDKSDVVLSIIKHTPSKNYQQVLESLPLTYDSYHVISSPFLSIEHVKVSEFRTLLHFTIKDSFLKEELVSSLAKDYGIDFSGSQPYDQITTKPIPAQDKLTLYDTIYISEKFDHTHPMLLIPIGTQELWMLPGTYTPEQAQFYVDFLHALVK